MKKFLMVLMFVVLSLPVFASENPVAGGNFVFTVPLFSYGKGYGDLWEDSGSYKSFGLGSVGYSSGGMSVGETNTIGMQYFIVKGLAIGANLGYNKISSQNDEYTIITVGPQAAYYINLNPVLLYAGGEYDYKRIKREGSVNQDLTLIKAKAGLAIMTGQNLALYGEATYSWDQLEKSGKTQKGNMLGASAGIKAFF